MSSQRSHLQLSEQLGRRLSTYTLIDLARGAKTLIAGQLAELTGLTTAAVTSILDQLENEPYLPPV